MDPVPMLLTGLPGDDTPRRLDELALRPDGEPDEPTTAVSTPIPARAAADPHDMSVPGVLDVVDDDRTPERRRGIFSWLRRSPAR